MLYGSALITSVLLDYKLISIGPILSSAATFTIPITFLLSDVITEVYGYQRTKRVIWSSLLCLFLFTVTCFLLNKIQTPVEYSKYGEAYNSILSLLLRAGLANIVAIIVGIFINIYVISKWKILLKGKYFWLRSLGSSIIGEALYSLMVVTLLNAGIVSFAQLIQILIISWCVKIACNIIFVTPSSLLVAFLKRAEKIDVYDHNIQFNPFKPEKAGT
jgi:uncharacterized integral membrane protein (TIGR00697 family)